MAGTEFHKLLINHEAEVANKALDFMDGKQLKHIIASLNDSQGGRKNWRSKGMMPRYRNLVKMIVEKSGLLFSEAPRMAVYTGETVSDVGSAQLLELLEGADWLEFFANVDHVVRLLKTGLVLVQSTPNGDLLLDCLHQGNSYVAINNADRTIDTLVYRVAGDCDGGEQDLRVITLALIEDYHVDKNGMETLTSSVPNPYGVIPVSVFHDTSIPRVGFWNFIPHDLVQINEMYNFHMIDSEYCASWVKNPTLFTNANINGGSSTLEPQYINGQPLPRLVPTESTIGGGPGAIVTISTESGAAPFVEYIGPEVNLAPIDDMFAKWVQDYAADWSVNVKTVGTAMANSGFQLVVEEADNLQLRKKRAQMFVAGFRRMFLVLKAVFNLTGDSLFAVFPQPDLPVDEMVDENVWTIRLTDGRASLVTYFEAKEGLTRDEAIAMVLQIQADKLLVPEAGDSGGPTDVPSNALDESGTEYDEPKDVEVVNNQVY